MITLEVVYLCRSTGVNRNDIFFASRFYSSFLRQKDIDSSIQLSLCVLIKGSNSNHLKSFFDQHNVLSVEIPDFGFDIDSYFRFASSATCDLMLPMSFTSYFTSPTSIRRLSFPFVLHKYQIESIPIISFSLYSFSSHRKPLRSLPLIYKRLHYIYSLRFIVLYLRGLFHFSDFPNMPNFHIRTTGFLISTSNYKAFFNSPFPPFTKYDCYQFESGFRSFTRYLQDGFRLYLADTPMHRPPS